MAPNMSLHSVIAVLILSTDAPADPRIFAKYYSPPHTSATIPTPTQPYATVKDQKTFEKGLLEKTAKTTSDVLAYDGKVIVFKMESDVMLYVVGGSDENEILLYNVILALRDSLSILLKNSTDKRTIIENYDLVALAIDEIVDDGIILETDPMVVSSRVSRAPAQDAPNMKNIDLSEQGLLNAWEFGKRKLAEAARNNIFSSVGHKCLGVGVGVGTTMLRPLSSLPHLTTTLSVIRGMPVPQDAASVCGAGALDLKIPQKWSLGHIERARRQQTVFDGVMGIADKVIEVVLTSVECPVCIRNFHRHTSGRETKILWAATLIKMKQRFSSLDVKVISHELSKSLVSLRIANIYDLSSRIFLFKCAKPGARQQLLVDSGFRCHLTAFTRTAAAAPSAFVTRLRKYLKSRRITSVVQIGTDRVIEIAFSDGQYRLYLEFFAAGNLILTDKDYTVLALLRQVSEGDEDVDVKLGSTYVLKAKQNFGGVPPLTQERVRETLSAQIQKAADATAAGGRKAKRYKGGEDLKKALSAGFSEYPAHLLDHAFKSTGFDPFLKPDAVLQTDALFARLMKTLEFANGVFQSLDALDQAKGYIVAKAKEPTPGSARHGIVSPPAREQVLYDDFHPFRPSQFEGKSDTYILEFDGFNNTVDEFYSSIESQKLESRLTEREEAAKRKLENARQDHEKRVGGLQQLQEMHIRKAQAIEANTHRVEEATAAVNGLIAQGMDWVDIGKLIENEQSRSNPVAQIIKLPLKLYENTVALLLDEASAGDESDDENDVTDDEDPSDEEDEKPTAKQKTVGDNRLTVDIDLALSPWANARQYYEQKKSAALKEQKTIQASTRALKSTEKKIEADLKKGLKQEKQSLRPARKAFWFEKFICFISSDGYLVLGGKDAQQNELLYRRYLKKGDIYVHADLQGAASVVVKNMIATPDAPIPPTTLSQAGALSVCTSSAWESKAVMAAWWVNSDQVSKTAPTGEYLTTGGFMIRGKKNFLPPSQLLLGFAVMFQISEESKVHHKKHRLQHIDSLTSEDVRNLADDAQDLSLRDPRRTERGAAEDGDIMADVGDAAEDLQAETDMHKKTAEGELEEGRKEEDTDSDVTGENTDQEDEAESDSEFDKDAVNPLQTNDHMKAESAAEHEEGVREGYSSQDEVDRGDGTYQTDDITDGKEQIPPPQASQDHKPAQPPPKPKQTPIPRGKRTKAKKAAKKYADQDEEDRALAMQLLGSAKAAEKKEAASLDKTAREAKLAADKERRRAQHERAAQAERIRQEKLAAGEALPDNFEQDEEVAEQERRELANLDAFVGTPMPGDEIVAAIPVVAPWNALGKCKYKTKLQPGSVKKGKAVREIVTRWMDVGKLGPKVVDESAQDRERVWPREIECIRTWRVEEVIGLLPVGKVRVVQGAGLGGGSGNAGGGGGGKGKGTSGSGARGGRGSKKGR